MLQSHQTTVPPNSGIPYHTLPVTDPRVIRRIPIWVNDPVVFCREAANFYPHWYQENLIRDRSLFIAASWSRQIGKSEGVAHKAIHHAFTRKNAVVIIIAPGQRQAKLLYQKITEAIIHSPLIYASIKGKPKMEETAFKNGSVIINLPSGDEGVNLRGYSITLLIIDEAAFVPDPVFIAVEQGLSSSGGQQVCISTPMGRHNSFFNMFYPRGEDGFPVDTNGWMVDGVHQVGDYSCHHYGFKVGLNVKRPDGTPQLSLPHLERQRRKLTEWQWLSEYEGQFVEDIDSFFNPKMVDRLFSENFSRYLYPEENKTYYMSVDIAKTRDYTAITIGELISKCPVRGVSLTNPHLAVRFMDYWKKTKTDENLLIDQYPKIAEIANVWRPETIFFDKTSMGEAPYEELKYNYHLPVEGVHFTQQEKVEMFNHLNLLMCSPAEIPGWESRIHSYLDYEAKTQFKNIIYEITETKTKQGHMRRGDQVKIYASTGHDDIPVAFALLCKSVVAGSVVTAVRNIKDFQQIARNIRVSSPFRPTIARPRARAAIASMAVGVAGIGNKPGYGRGRSSKVFWR